MWNIIFGLVAIVGGASGQLVLRGTNNSTALMVVGAGLVIYGIFQVVRGNQSE